MILAFLGKGVGNVTLALVIVGWGALRPHRARAPRWSSAQREYIEAAECLACRAGG